MTFLATIEGKLILAAVAIAVVGCAIWFTYHKGETAGSSGVKVEVQRETIKAQDAARISKEKTDAEVHSTPYSDRVDGLR